MSASVACYMLFCPSRVLNNSKHHEQLYPRGKVVTRPEYCSGAPSSKLGGENSLILDIFVDRATWMPFGPYTWPRHTYTRVASLLGVFHCRRTFRLGRHVEATGGTPRSGCADVRIKFKEYLIGVRSFRIMPLRTYDTRLATGNMSYCHVSGYTKN